MHPGKHTLGTSKSSRKHRNTRCAAAVNRFFEELETRRLMTTLNVSQGTNVTLDVTPGGGIETIIDGDKTDYSAGQFGYVLVDTSGTITIKAIVVPVTIDYAYND